MSERERHQPHVVLHGQEAIHYAKAHGLRLNQSVSENGTESGGGLSIAEAEALAEHAPEKVWLEIRTGVSTGD